MQREVIHGIPFLCDKTNKLYVYEPSTGTGPGASTTPFQIGTKTADGYQLIDGWEQKFQERLTSWRAELKSRSRKPAAASKTTSAATSR